MRTPGGRSPVQAHRYGPPCLPARPGREWCTRAHAVRVCACVRSCAAVRCSTRTARGATHHYRSAKRGGNTRLTAEDQVQLRALVCQPLVVWHARVRHRNHEFAWGCGLSALGEPGSCQRPMAICGVLSRVRSRAFAFQFFRGMPMDSSTSFFASTPPKRAERSSSRNETARVCVASTSTLPLMPHNSLSFRTQYGLDRHQKVTCVK